MHDTPPDGPRWLDILATGGETGAAIAAHDWSGTPLGPIDSWPQSLRTAVTVCLHSPVPMLLWWGEDLLVLHNDAYLPLLGARHGALGRPGAEVWPERWDAVGPMLTGVLAGRGATWHEDQPLLLDRSGFVEECWFTYSYSPVLDESGTPGGVLTTVTETTDRVVGDRRLRLLTTLVGALVDVTEPDEVGRRTIKALADSASVPFVRLHLAGEAGPRLVAGSDVEPPPGAAESWPLAEVLASGKPRVVPFDPADGDGPGAPKVALVPVPESGGAAPTAVLVTGFNPRRPVDADYLSFMELLAGHVGTALAGARAYQAEHRRAEALAERRRTDAISRALLDSAPVGFGLVDTELRYVQVNPALALMNHAPAAAHLGRRPAEMAPEHGARIEELMRRALADGPLVGVEFTHGPADAPRRTVASYFPIRISATDELVGLGVSVVDVTERTRLLEALGTERARYERLAATDVLAVFGGEEERITEANEAFLAMLGYTPADVARGRLSWPAITPPGWEEADARALVELAETGRARAFDKEYLHADGHRVPVQIGVVALHREPLRWLAYALDLSAERAAQAELRLFQALVERSGDFIAVATPDGRAVYVNPAGRALVGLGDTDRVDGLALVDFAAPDVRELWRTELIPTALREGHHRAESRLLRLDTGEQLDVDHQTFTVTTGDGRDTTAFVATVARDVSDRQRALRQAEALARLAGALSSARGRPAIVDVMTTVAPAVVDATTLRVAIARPGVTVLDLAGGDSPAGPLPLDADEPLARAVRENTALPLAGGGGRTTGVCLPLRYGDGGALGALEVRWARPVDDDEALRNLLDAVAGLCSQALQRAELTGSAQAMAEFAARLSVTRSTAEAIDVILDAAPTALGAVLPGLAMRDEGRLVRLWYHDMPESLSATFDDLTIDDPRPIVRALRDGERVVLRDRAEFAAQFPGLPDPVGTHGLVTTVALPLFDAQRQPIAGLGFGWLRERPLRDSDLALLDTIADLCEQTLERVRLAAAEHNLVTRLAGRLRSSALTTPDGLEIATRYQPAMTGLHLGGDWYDLVRQDDHRLAVVVGDVVGHQVEAAADMAQLRTVLNTLIRLGVPLEEVFLRLTELLGVGFLGTCLIVVVDPANRAAHVLRAGHPHPVLLPAGQEPRTVQTPNARPLGLVDAPMAVTTVPFEPGDLLVAYTDGLVERRDQPYDEGVAALHRALVAVRDEPVEAIADALLRDLPGADDDRALVVLRHTG